MRNRVAWHDIYCLILTVNFLVEKLLGSYVDKQVETPVKFNIVFG